MLETYSGTVDPSLARVAFLWAVSHGLQAVKMDVSTAFLQAPIKDAVWLRLPSNLPVEVYPGLRAGVFVRIQKAVYGLKDAPKVYTSYFKKKLAKKEGRLGIEMQLVDESEIVNLEKISGDNTVFWLSKKLARKLGSTTSAELLAMRDAVNSSWSIAHLVRKLWEKMPPVIVVTDSQPLMFQLSSKQCKSEPRIQGELEYMLENLAELGAKVK
uniref:Reverse transcriptase Ty1/copia-type domain-containing protein n=1 Tax=Chromera velia CCMP2878 TaxID=1169474 RepID=A0A0G4GYL6_9ALVE|eukprot:Cvel_5414.t1-p1 / transcript=Cvel_5414.t1 / gene=Cvel_5414 / organism=Chromera_velia_CCMP2878 / gene_product=hypothetical protein / transcript_product=hypothetical protein / location=Cvel_scaffold252:25129-26355(+) / protein_length=212 / sequence_SO=supercontig / SO=protein_coding / is_pseudo=false